MNRRNFLRNVALLCAAPCVPLPPIEPTPQFYTMKWETIVPAEFALTMEAIQTKCLRRMYKCASPGFSKWVKSDKRDFIPRPS